MWQLFKTFFQIGLFTFGGGYAMIPLIQARVVEQKGWIAEEEFVDLIAVAQSCPGVFAVNIGIFVGYRIRRTAGAMMCMLGAVLPSFVVILAIALCFQHFRENVWVDHFFRGLRPAVVALIAAPVFKMGRMARLRVSTLWIPLLAALAIWLWGVSPVYVILLAGLGGYLYGRVASK